MDRLIKLFSDGSKLLFDKGVFDEWCVYMQHSGARKYAPTDVQYFVRLQQYARTFGAKVVYADFLKIYELTKKSVSAEVLACITELSANYGNNSTQVEMDFTIIYAGMIAEENKAHTKLGKRIKKLGVYQVLIESVAPTVAAQFSKGKKWTEIEQECIRRGI